MRFNNFLRPQALSLKTAPIFPRHLTVHEWCPSLINFNFQQGMRDYIYGRVATEQINMFGGKANTLEIDILLDFEP